MLCYTDTVYEGHDMGPHPESPERLAVLRRLLGEWGLLDRMTRPPCPSCTDEDILSIHTPERLALVRGACDRARASGGRASIDADTSVSPGSWDAASRALGAACDATDRVLGGEDDRALLLVRPPGHHAVRGTDVFSNGFCLFNNVAAAAQRAIASHGLERVLIVDWDVHHGNGTQDIFYARNDVYYVSLHRYPFYPGTGAREERGRGEGEGTTLNRPLDAWSTTADSYVETFRDAVETAFEAHDPQLVIVSAGFDTLASDPLAGLGLIPDTFTELTRVVVDLARAGRADGRVIVGLEGGYDPVGEAEAMARCVEVLLDGS